MYENILLGLKTIMQYYETEEDITDRDRHNIVIGIKSAIELVEQEQEYVVAETAYDTFESVVDALKHSLTMDEMKKILEDRYWSDYDDEGY